MSAQRVGILGVGLVTAGGVGVNETWRALKAGTDNQSSRLCPDGVTRRVHTAAPGEDKLFALAWSAIGEALAGSNLRPDTICLGSSSDTIAGREMGRYAPAPLIVDQLATALTIANKYQFSNACASSSVAIATAMDLIRSGRSRVALAGGVDEVTFSSIAGFDACRIYSDRCRPFAAGRNGLVLADGAAFLLLVPDGMGEPLAYLTGAGLASDAAHMAAMTEDGVLRAMAGALTESGLTFVDAIIAHGTATQRNDLVEANAINSRWSGLPRPLIASYKGILGHPQGASGAVGAVLAVKALLAQRMFATVSAADIDEELAIGNVVTTVSESVRLRTIMCLSHGTWGVYSALVMSEARP